MMQLVVVVQNSDLLRGGAEGPEGRVHPPPGQSGRVLCLGAGGRPEAPG